MRNGLRGKERFSCALYDIDSIFFKSQCIMQFGI
jgi:hypothetical protein